MGLNWSRPLTGTFLGVFIIVYGQIQSWCPQLVLGPLKQAPANKYVAMLWAGILLLVPLGLGPTILTSPPFQEHDTTVMSAILIVRPSRRARCIPTLFSLGLGPAHSHHAFRILGFMAVLQQMVANICTAAAPSDVPQRVIH